MTIQPLVSVIVICYNSADYILETLDSVYFQTYHNVELIISDDCSNDCTVSLCETWLEKNGNRFIRNKLIRSNTNTGVSANYNRAVRACKGEWVKNVDGDDLLSHTCIQDNIDYINDNPEAKLIISNVTIFTGDNPKRLLGEYIADNNMYFFQLSAEEQFKTLLRGNLIPSQSSFIKLELLKLFPYNEVYRGLEDEPMWLTLTRNGYKAHFFNKCTSYYRKCESTTLSDKRFYSPIYVESVFLLFWREKFDYIKKYNLREAYNVNRRTLLLMEFGGTILNNKKTRFNNLLFRIVARIVSKISFQL